MADSLILVIRDAIVTQVRELSDANTEVVGTFLRRFDADKAVGRKAYVVAVSDGPTDASQGGDRGHDPFLYRYSLEFFERLPKGVITFDDRDAFAESFVDWVTVVRDWFDESRNFVLVAGVPLVPVETGERVTLDWDDFGEKGIAKSGFTTAIREG